MMKRRTLVAGVGSFTASSALIVGTGAFTSASAERSIAVETARDSNALLRLVPNGSLERSGASGGTVEFAFPSKGERASPEPNPNLQDPQGLGTDSVYRFASDVNGSNGLFEAMNQGTQPVDVYGTQIGSTDGVPNVDIFDVSSGNVLTPDDPYTGLGVGNSIRLGFEIDTSEVEARENNPYQITFQIVAEASD